MQGVLLFLSEEPARVFGTRSRTWGRVPPLADCCFPIMPQLEAFYSPTALSDPCPAELLSANRGAVIGHNWFHQLRDDGLTSAECGDFLCMRLCDLYAASNCERPFSPEDVFEPRLRGRLSMLQAWCLLWYQWVVNTSTLIEDTVSQWGICKVRELQVM